MEKLVLLAKQYYAEFEKNDWRNPWTWISILILAVFVVLVCITFAQGSKVNSAPFWLMLAAEVMGLFTIEKAREDRKKSILKKYNGSYSNMFLPQLFKDVDTCKRHFLSLAFNKSERDYLSLSREVKEAIDRQDSLRSNVSKSLSQWRLYIYDPESKPRINALLIMLFSTTILLSSKEGASISSVFEFYDGITLPVILLMLFSVVIFWGLFLFIQSLLRLLTGTVIPEPNLELKYLLRDLIKFHDFLGN